MPATRDSGANSNTTISFRPGFLMPALAMPIFTPATGKNSGNLPGPTAMPVSSNHANLKTTKPASCQSSGGLRVLVCVLSAGLANLAAALLVLLARPARAWLVSANLAFLTNKGVGRCLALLATISLTLGGTGLVVAQFGASHLPLQLFLTTTLDFFHLFPALDPHVAQHPGNISFHTVQHAFKQVE